MTRKGLVIAYGVVFMVSFWIGGSSLQAHTGCTVNTSVTPNTWRGDEHDNICDAGPGFDSMSAFGGNDNFGGGGDRDLIRGATGNDLLTDHSGGNDNDDECDGDGQDELHVDDGDTRDLARFGNDGDNDFVHHDSLVEGGSYSGDCPI